MAKFQSYFLTLVGGVSYDLESRTVERLRQRFSEEISERRYETKNENFLALTGSTNKVDLIILCMVMEHLNDDLERQFMWLTCLVFSSQFHLETPAPVIDSDFHCDTNSSGVWYSKLEWGRTAL